MNQLKTIRKQLKLSQFALANMSGIGRYRISLLEMGYANPTDDETRRLTSALRNAKRLNRGRK